MDALTISHARPPNKSLHVETTTRALRHSVWIALYLSHELEMPGLTCALTRTLVEIDRLLGEFDLC